MNNLHHNPSKKSGRIIAGFILTALGLVLLLRQLDWFVFPSWLFSWPMILIIVGLVQRAKSRSKNSSWLILIVTGCLFLLEKIFPGQHIVNYGWPVIFIVLGLWIIFYRNNDLNTKNTSSKEAFVNDAYLNPETGKGEAGTAQARPESGEDFVNCFSVFSGSKKNVFSKDFKGGEIVNIFGGTDLDFSHANLNGQVVIDVVQLFGGTKLIVPPHWQVVADVTQIFGGVNDKRIPHPDVATSGKVLVLKGISIFGGVDIKSF